MAAAARGSVLAQRRSARSHRDGVRFRVENVSPSARERFDRVLKSYPGFQFLTERERSVLMLRSIFGLMYDEAAAVLGVSYNSARLALSRACSKLNLETERAVHVLTREYYLRAGADLVLAKQQAPSRECPRCRGLMTRDAAGGEFTCISCGGVRG